jgi:hypothetical protein
MLASFFFDLGNYLGLGINNLLIRYWFFWNLVLYIQFWILITYLDDMGVI